MTRPASRPLRARLAIVIAVACLAAAPTAATAARPTPDQAVAPAFERLAAQIRQARALSAAKRRALLAIARRAAAQRNAGRRPCEGLRTLETLRLELHRTPPRRLPGLNEAEQAILATASGASCAHFARTVRIGPEPLIVAGTLRPLKPVRKKPEEEEGVAAPPVPAGAGAPERGPETAVVPAADRGAGASGPFAFSRITDLGTPRISDYPAEPSQASAGKVVWYTGNSGAAFSLDGGATFKHVDPRRMFPEVDRAFCCDQVVLYSPRINRFIWFVQYWCPKPDQRCDEPGSTNLVRLLVASPQAIAANRQDPASAWDRWVIRPRDIGRKREMFDYPDLALGRHSLYITSNAFGGKEGEFTRSLLARVRLGQLKAGRDFTLHYDRDRHFSFKPAQDAGRRAVLASNDTPTSLFSRTWDEGSPLLFPHRTRHSVNAVLDYESQTGGTGSVDWGERLDERITGATRRGQELWLAWSEGRSACLRGCNGDDPEFDQLWPQPHVHVVVLNVRTLGLVRERFVHNSNFAIAYPSLATDSRGDVGMTFSYGGGTAGNASPAAGYLTGAEEFHQVAASPAAGDQGDFFSLRTDYPDRSRFTASGYVAKPDRRGAPATRWLFYRFSRASR